MTTRTFVRRFSTLRAASLGLLLASGCVAEVSGHATGDDDTGSADAGTPDTTQATDTFVAGDEFDYSLVEKPSQMVATMVTELGYVASTAPRAIAINFDGLGYVSVLPTATQAEATRNALQACFVIGGNKPCVVLAAGNTFQINSTALTDAGSYTVSLLKPAALTDIPFVADGVRNGPLVAYAAKAGVKAIAIGLDGHAEFVPNPSGKDTVKTQAEVERLALERCEMTSRNAPCTLFASANTVVFDPAAPKWTAAIDFTRTTVKPQIPGMTDTVYTEHMVPYLTGVSQGQQGVTYIAEDGAGGNAWTTSQAAADSQALGFCNMNVGVGFRCFHYAINKSVAMTAQDLGAIHNHSLALHCSTMPRLDCATHKLMGCTTSGSYYTTHAGGVSLETCTF